MFLRLIQHNTFATKSLDMHLERIVFIKVLVFSDQQVLHSDSVGKLFTPMLSVGKNAFY